MTWIIRLAGGTVYLSPAMARLARDGKGSRILDAELPRHLFSYALTTSWPHQLLLVVLTVSVFLLEVVPLELQRRVVNDLAERRPFRSIFILCGVYAAIILVQGSIKLIGNIYRGWIGERAKLDLRHHIRAACSPEMLAAEAQGTAISMLVAEVEPIGGFIGESISEPLLQGGILLSVLAYIVHLDPWMALAAFLLFVPQFVFVPLLQAAVNRRASARIQMLREVGIGVITLSAPGRLSDDLDEQRIKKVFDLNISIFRLKFSMNFLMNLCSHLQVVAALLLGGWWVYAGRLEIGGIVAFISGVGRLNDPWGDLVNYFRDLTTTQVRFRLLANAMGGLRDGGTQTRVGHAAGFDPRQ